ncbi:MAG TPA: hypothetical protein P5142_17780 [Spirochaetia bacterium]|nr:hypothetical protein [Spirochaetia bacterium]
MSDQERGRALGPGERRAALGSSAAPAIAGLAAGLLYASVAFAPLCLVPIQVAYGRRGRRAGLAATGAAVAAVAAALAARLYAVGALGLAELGGGLLPPLAMLGALALVNARFWAGLPATYRLLAVGGIASLAALPSLLSLSKDPAFSAYLSSRLESLLSPLRAQAGGQGYEASVLAAALDPATIAAAALRTLSSIYAAALALTLGFCWWVGNRLSGPGSPGREAAPPLSLYRAPYALLWAFLAAWALVLAAMTLGAPEALQAAAWNLALSASLPYAAQGLGIAASLAEKLKMPRFMRVALGATAAMALVSPTSSLVVAIGLPLLGVTEVWIPYRNPKGVGA